MSSSHSRLKTSAIRRALKKKELSREVSVDDVIKELIDLFDYLGVDAGGLAKRLTGIKKASAASKRLYPHIAAIGELLTHWHEDADYLDPTGSPLAIRRVGRGRSFRRLALTSVPDMDPRQVLSELEEIGAVQVDEKGLIHVRMRSLPVYENKRLAVQHTLAALDGFIKTLRHNLNSSPSNAAQLFHRVARNGNFDLNEIPALKIRVKRHGQGFLESCDNWMKRRSAPLSSSRSKKKHAQVSIGVYLSVDRS
jgi:hypothetical protein